jgi:hypothetical protein
MRLALASFSVLLTSLVLAAAANAVPPTVSSLGGKRVEAQFVEPDAVADHEDETPVLERVSQMIRDVPAGGTLAMGLYSVNYPVIYYELVNAVNRGVNVYIAESGDQDKDAGLGQEIHAIPGIHHIFCGPAGSGNDSCTSLWDPSIQHSKFATFSQTRDTSGAMQSNVVWFGTANLTHETGGQAMNDTITVYNDPDLFNNFFWGLFLSMWNQSPRQYNFEPNADPATQPTAHFFTAPTTGIEVKASPSGNPLSGVTHDLVVDELNKITPGPNCQIRVMEASFKRNAVANKLAQMKGAGCSVYLLAGTDLGCSAKATLQAAGVPIRQRDALHSKTMLTQGQSLHQSIFTGSHNVLPGALKNDELLVRLPVDNNSLYMGYWNYFGQGWSNSSTTLTCTNVY